MAQACTRQGVDVSCDDGRRGDLRRRRHHLGRRHAIESGLAASERHHRQQIVGHRRARRVRRPGQGRGADGKSRASRARRAARCWTACRTAIELHPDPQDPAYRAKTTPCKVERARSPVTTTSCAALVIPRAAIGRAERPQRRRISHDRLHGPLSSWLSCSASMKSANHCWIVWPRSFVIIASQRIRRSVSGIESAVAMVRAMPSISCGFTSSAVSSSLAAPANFDSTSTPGSAGFCAATYSLATRFMPSCSGVTTPTCAVR